MKLKITPCLWFDAQAEEAAAFYVSVFPNSRIREISRYPDEGREVHCKPPGSVMTVVFELDGQRFMALNGGPQFKFDEAISFQVRCDTQDEIDRYWEALCADGGTPGPCGWLKDKFGLSWQITPSMMSEFFSDANPEAPRHAMRALLKMGKIEIAALRRPSGQA